MFNFDTEKLQTEPLFQGRFGPVYPYKEDKNDNESAVQIISATNQELPGIVEQIIMGFTYEDPSVIPVKDFFMKPAEEISGEAKKWDVYIKQLQQEQTLEISSDLKRAMFDFKEERLDRQTILGEGTFGAVHPYREDLADDKWVVKAISTTNAQLYQVIQEIMIGFSCEHPNILPVEGFYMEPVGKEYVSRWNIYIKMPRMQGTLKDRLEKRNNYEVQLTEVEFSNYISQIVSGLRFMHANKIAHRDLKPGNILLDSNGNAYIADMGQANLTADKSEHLIQNGAGTKSYRAPELEGGEGKKLKNKDLLKADMWSLGLVLAEICFIDTNIKGTPKQKEAILKRNFKNITDHDGLDFPKLDLLGLDLKKLNNQIGTKDVEDALNNGERLEELKTEALENGKLDLFYQQLQQARYIMNFHHAVWLKNSSPLDLEDMVKLLQSDPEKRPNIEDLHDDLVHHKAIKLLVKEANRRNQYDMFYEMLGIEEDKKNYENAKRDPTSFTYARLQIEEDLREEREINVEEIFGLAIRAAEQKLQIFKQTGVMYEKNLITVVKDALTKTHGERFFFTADEVTQSLKIKISTPGYSWDSTGNTNTVNNQVVRNMLRSLHEQINQKGCRKLQSLTLCTDSLSVQNDLASDTFTDLVGTDMGPIGIMNLKRINIEITSGFSLTAEGFKGLFRYIGTYHKNLSALHLNFHGRRGLADDAINELALQIETNLKHLKRIDLCLRQCCNISDAAMKKLLQAIGMRRASLKNLTLDIQLCTQFSGDILIELGNQIQGLDRLFSLILYINPLGSNASSHLFQKIGTLQNLSVLKLDLLDYTFNDLKERSDVIEINDADREALLQQQANIDHYSDLSDGSDSTNKSQIMVELNELRLRDVSVLELANSISRLPLLRILSLSFMGTIKVTNDSAQQLIARIGSCHDFLGNLTLRFYGCEDIKDSTVQELQKQLQILNPCSYLTLSFSRSFKISSKAIQSLVQSITQDEEADYQYLGLYFAGCSLLDEDSCEEIIDIVSQRQISQRLVLDLSGLVEDRTTRKRLQAKPTITGIEIKL